MIYLEQPAWASERRAGAARHQAGAHPQEVGGY
jgi:hypothetical protein